MSRKSLGGSRLVLGALMRLSHSANKRQELPHAPRGSREGEPAGRREDPLRHPRVAARWLLRYLEESDEVTIGEPEIAASCLAIVGSDEEAARVLPARVLQVTAERATRRRRAQGVARLSAREPRDYFLTLWPPRSSSAATAVRIRVAICREILRMGGAWLEHATSCL
jgi:hypothetical protein